MELDFLQDGPEVFEPGTGGETAPPLAGTADVRRLSQRFPALLEPPAFADAEEQEQARARESVEKLDLQELRQQAYNNLVGGLQDGDTPVRIYDEYENNGVRQAVSFLRKPENKLAYLQDRFPHLNARMVDVGEEGDAGFRGQHIMVRQLDKSTGEFYDVFFDSPDFSSEDFNEAVGGVLPLAGGIAGGAGGAVFGAPSGPGAIATTAAGFALGEAVTGGAQDAIARSIMGLDVDPGEIAASRGRDAVTSFGIDVVTAGLGKIGSRLVRRAPTGAGATGLSVPGGLRRAVKKVNDELGIEVPLTLGDETGFKMIQKFEGFLSSLPGGGPVARVVAQQETKVREIMQRIVPEGSGRGIGNTEVGQEVIDNLQGLHKSLTKAAESRAGIALDVAMGDLKNATGIINPTKVDRTQYGGGIVHLVEERMKDVRLRRGSAYEQVRELEPPGGVVPTSAALEFLQSLADGTGDAVSQGTVDFINRIPEVKQIIAAEGAPITVDMARKIRTKLNGARDFNGAAQDLDQATLTKLLSHVNDGLTQAEKLGTPEFRRALKGANKIHREEMVPLRESGIFQILAPGNGVPGFRGAELLDRFISGGSSALENFNQLRNAMGSASPQAEEVLRQSIMGVAFHKATRGTLGRSSVLDADTFIKQFDSTDPQITSFLFGKGKGLADKKAVAAVIDQVKLISNGRIDINDVMRLTRDGTPIRKALSEAAAAQAKRDDIFADNMLKSLKVDGDSPVDPEDVVNTVFASAKNGKDVKRLGSILDSMDRRTRQDVERVFVQKMLRDSARSSPSPDDILTGSAIPSLDKLSKWVNEPDPVVRGKIEAMVGGKDVLEGARAVRDIVNGTIGRYTDAALSGFARNEILSQATAGKGNLKSAVGRFFYSALFTNRLSKSFFRRAGRGQPMSNIELLGLLTSEDFVRTAVQQAGENDFELDAFVEVLSLMADDALAEGREIRSREEAARFDFLDDGPEMFEGGSDDTQ